MLSNCGAGEDSWESLGCKEIKPVNPKGNQPWIFIRRTNAEAEAPKFWLPDTKSQLTGKDPVAGKDWRQEEKGTTEDEMARWYHWLNGRESEWTPGVGDGQGGLACCESWSRKELDMTEWLNWTELREYFIQPMGKHEQVIYSGLQYSCLVAEQFFSQKQGLYPLLLYGPW